MPIPRTRHGYPFVAPQRTDIYKRARAGTTRDIDNRRRKCSAEVAAVRASASGQRPRKGSQLKRDQGLTPSGLSDPRESDLRSRRGSMRACAGKWEGVSSPTNLAEGMRARRSATSSHPSLTRCMMFSANASEMARKGIPEGMALNRESRVLDQTLSATVSCIVRS